VDKHTLGRILVSQLIVASFIVSALAQSPKPVDFVFHGKSEGRWEGSCISKTPVFQTAIFTIAPAKSVTTGSWRKDISPTLVWSGVEVDSDYVDSTIEIEVYTGGFGVLRSQDGWYAISGFSQSTEFIRFQVDTSQEVQSSELDRDIIRRAASILSSDSVWNHGADDRHCAAEATRWSVYCAMERATAEITGGFHHRRPALQLVRRIVEERTVGRKYRHRLMDYNNDPSTTFEDVGSVFAEALRRIHH
jgi:hypothetical protein